MARRDIDAATVEELSRIARDTDARWIEASRELDALTQARREARAARDSAIRAALDAGSSVLEVARAAELSRVRIYQIRDGRR